MTSTLDSFLCYSYIWTKDREAELEKFIASNPLLLDFEAKIKEYEALAATINALPTTYDVGPLSLYSGMIFFNVGFCSNLRYAFSHVMIEKRSLKYLNLKFVLGVNVFS